jgi:hypothetical protein
MQRWIFPHSALRSWFSDVLFLPAAIPVYLWMERKLGLRTHDRIPSLAEVGALFLAWSLAAEVVAPRLFVHCTSDPLDVLAYAAGGLFALGWWTWFFRQDDRFVSGAKKECQRHPKG